MAKRFVGTSTHSQGHDPAIQVQGKIVNVNPTNWTVDVVSSFDRHYWRDVQVSSPYLHPNNGEGIYIMPEYGAQCSVMIPSDTTPPYIVNFLAPMDVRDVGDADEARSRNGPVPFPTTDARFDGGRPPAQPGDIFIRGRDGNFCILHRGGVLEIGSTELCQRIFMPINNHMLDVSGIYEHLNTGGGVRWGLLSGDAEKTDTRYVETIRLLAGDQFCDIRIQKGSVEELGEPDGDLGEAAALAELGIAQDATVVYEMVLSPGGFMTNGSPSSPSVRNETKMRLLFDKEGGTLLRSSGSLLLRYDKGIRFKTLGVMDLQAQSITMTSTSGAKLDGGPLTEINGDIVKVSGGARGAARIGDTATVVFAKTPVFISIAGAAPVPCTIDLGTAVAFIDRGSDTLLTR